IGAPKRPAFRKKGATGPSPRRTKAKTKGGRRKSAPAETSETTPPPPAPGFAPVALGPCPLCGADVVEQEKSYGCSAWKSGCKFPIWKKIAGKSISVRIAQSLLKQKRTQVLKGFQSRTGKPFETRLKLDGGEVRFDFGN